MFTVTTLHTETSPTDPAVPGVTAPDAGEHPSSTPLVRFAVDVDGERLASGELMAGTWVGDETGQMITVRWAAGQVEAARAVVEAVIAAATPGRELHITASVEVHDWLDERRALIESCGFTLWQEKEGFWWTDRGQDLPAPEGVTVRTLTEVGREAYVDVIEACTAGTLDRVDADAIASMGARGWAEAFFDACDTPEDRDTWYVIDDPAGEPVGFVALGTFDEGPEVGTILHIGVVATHRGHGYVDQLFRLVNRAARTCGWTHMISDVDVLNPPMMTAMERHGHHAADRPWHKWIYRRLAG